MMVAHGLLETKRCRKRCNAGCSNGMVAVGVPARVIMTTTEYARKCKASMGDFDEEQYEENKRDYLLKWCK